MDTATTNIVEKVTRLAVIADSIRAENDVLKAENNALKAEVKRLKEENKELSGHLCDMGEPYWPHGDN